MSETSAELVAAIEKAGYYPAVVTAGVMDSVAGEEIVSFLVHHEPTIERDEVRRHITVVVLTPSRLILCHTDEHSGDDLLPEPYTASTSEAVSLSSVKSVVINKITANAAGYRSRVPAPTEAVLTVGWGGVSRIDIEPAICHDPQCEADHGYTGMIGSDDFSMRVSAAADGPDAVSRLVTFSQALSQLSQVR